MQTFLPYPNIWASARCLDDKRLGKQRVECKQILITLGVDVGEHRGNPESRWRNHPAVRMWRGHELYLAEYGEIMCAAWRNRGFKDTLREQFRPTAVKQPVALLAQLARLRPASRIAPQQPAPQGCSALRSVRMAGASRPSVLVARGQRGGGVSKPSELEMRMMMLGAALVRANPEAAKIVANAMVELEKARKAKARRRKK